MRRVLFSLLVVGVVFALAYGAAASISVSDSNVGSGTGTVSGYSVTNVSWTLDSSDPTLVAAVSFTINSTSATVKVTTNGTKSGGGSDGFGNWSCTNSSGSVSCNASTKVQASTITQLTVAAAN